MERRRNSTMTTGERIRKSREEIGMSQSKLAELCGVAKQTIYKYEKDIITNIPMDNLKKVASILRVTPAYLMGFEDMEKKADVIADLVLLMEVDDDFRIAVQNLAELKEENQQAYTASVNMINAFKK
jgi:transcriptional regulator with XRE-family HTH domain